MKKKIAVSFLPADFQGEILLISKSFSFTLLLIRNFFFSFQSSHCKWYHTYAYLAIIVLSILTIEEKAGSLDTQSVRGHTGVVPIILLSDVVNHENGGGTKNLDVDSLGIGQPGDVTQTEVRQYM